VGADSAFGCALHGDARMFMKTNSFCVRVALLTGSLFSFIPSALADAIEVFSGGAPQGVLRTLAPRFEKETGHKINFTFGLVTAIQQRLERRERADLILLPMPLLAAVERESPFRNEGRGVLARVGIAVIVPEATQPPTLNSTEAIKKLLSEARKVAVPEPSTPSGAQMARLFKQLGLGEVMRPKLIARAAINGGGELVAKGEADVGFYLLSEIQAIAGLKVAGLLPAELQSFVVYGTAIPASSFDPTPALAFRNYIADRSRSGEWTAAGFELVTK
jgi:molybdate transport system substrate-binding protein